VLLGVSLIVFGLVHTLPGGPEDILLGYEATHEALEQLRRNLGLDRPIYIQYADWMWRILHGDFGKSISGESVARLFATALPATLYLMAASMAISLAISIPVGVFTATKRHTLSDYFGMIFALLGISCPSFWLAVLFIWLFSVILRILPSAGFYPLLEDPVMSLKALILPSITLGVILAGTVTRQTRSSILEVLTQDYIKFAKLKGLSERVVYYKHALKPALIPVVTVVGMQTGSLLSGTVAIETIFLWPGMGQLLLYGIYRRDYLLVQGAILIFALLFFIINIITDIIYTYVDPRIRFE
jgi:peptide/nickel transport system permease protein